MAVTLRSGRELDERRVESKNTEEEKQDEIGEEHEKNSSEATEKEKSVNIRRTKVPGELRTLLYYIFLFFSLFRRLDLEWDCLICLLDMKQ